MGESNRLVKTELEEAGLETDGMAETTSQLQTKLKALTDGKVDIMVDSNSFKSTTQILREMAAEWENLTDVEQAAALELLGGKRQANILAAILNNFDIVEETIETSANSAGSALAENEKYLDSIQGRINLFNNAIQTMWSHTLDDDFIKGFVDFGTVLVKLIDQVGLLQSALLALVAVKSIKNKMTSNELLGTFFGETILAAKAATSGKGFKDGMQSKTDPDTSGVDAETEAIKRNTAEKQKNAEVTAAASGAETKDTIDRTENANATKAETSAKQENTGAKLDNANATQANGVAEDKDTQDTLENIGATNADTNATNANTLANIENANSSQAAAQGEQADTTATNANTAATATDTATTKTNTATNVASAVGGAVGAVGTASVVTKTAKAMGGLSSAIGLVATAGKGLLKVVGAFLKSNWIILVITLLPSLIKWLTNLKSAEDKLAEQTAELKEEWDSLYSTISGLAKEFSSLKKSADELIPKYAELAQGINAFGKNVSLTDEQYEEFLSANNQLLELFPDLNTFLDENGNRIINLSGNVDVLTESLNKLVEAKRLEKAEEIADTMPDVMKNIRDTSKLYEKEKKNLEKNLEWAKQDISSVQQGYETSGIAIRQGLFASYDDDEMHEIISKYRDQFGNTDWKAFVNSEELQIALDETEQSINGYSNRIQSTWARLNQVMSQWMLTNEDYNRMDSDVQNIAQKLVSGFDFSTIDYGWWHFNDDKQAQDYVEDNLIAPLKNARPEVQALIASLFDFKEEFDAGAVGAAGYLDVIDQVTTELKKAGLNDNTIQAIKVSLDLEDVERKVETLEKYGLTHDQINSFKGKELEYAYKIVQSADSEMSFEELSKKVTAMRYAGAAMINPFDFSDMTSGLDKAVEGLDSAISAMNKLKEGTALTKAELAQLALEYPKLLESANMFTDGSIQGQKDMLNTILDMKEQEYDAEIDVKIKELEATRQVLQDQLTLEEDKANLIQEIKAWQADGSLQKEQELVNKIKELNDLQGRNYVSMQEGTLTVNEEALNDKLKQEQDFGQQSATNIWTPFAKTISTSFEKGATGGLKALNNLGVSILSWADKIAKNILTPLANGIKGIFEGKGFSGFKGVWEGIKTTVTGDSDLKVTFDGSGAKIGSQSLSEWTSSQESASAERIKAIQNMDSKILNAINNLQGLKGLDIEEIYDKNAGKDKDKDKDKEAEQTTAYERFQRLYERKLANLEAQQTHIENQIKEAEAKEEGVSASYYEAMIAKEEEVLALHTAQRDVLQSLLGAQKSNIDASQARMNALSSQKTVTEEEAEELEKLKAQVDEYDKIADSLWEVEHAIQESTIKMIEFRKEIAKLYDTASSGISDAYDNKGQLFDDRKSFIENEISIRETKGELIPTSVYDELIEQEKQKRANAEAELNAQADLYWQGINAGHFEADSEQAIAFLEKIRQKKLEMQESDQATAEYIEQQKDAYIVYIDKMMEAYDRRNDFFQSQFDYAQSYIDRLGVLNINVPDEAYEKMAEIQGIANNNLKDQMAFLNSELNALGEQGIDQNDPRYIEKFDEVVAIEQEWYEGETKLLELQQQIIDNHIDRFNQVVDRINHATGQLENVSNLISDKDVANEDGSWTAEGITQAGMAYHQMQINEETVKKYSKEMEYLNEQYEKGKISEKEYTEQMQELTDGQWDAINAYKSAEDAIISLNEARIDMIEQGLNEEMEAYQELIDLKKEELDAERDLYDFKKNTQKQTKEIGQLQRRIASMSGSTDAATVAERTKLEKD